MRAVVVLIFILFGSEAFASDSGQKFLLDHESPSKPTYIEVFSETDVEFYCVVRPEPEEGKFKVSADIYRVMSSTVAPVEKGRLLLENEVTEGESPDEKQWVASLNYQFPKTSAPQRFLIKMWLEKEESKTTLATELITVMPDALLHELAGETIRIISSKPNDVADSVVDALKKAGATVLVEKTLPAQKDSIPTFLFDEWVTGTPLPKSVLIVGTHAINAPPSHPSIALTDLKNFLISPVAQRRFINYYRLLKP